MISIAIGSNISHVRHGAPSKVCESAITSIRGVGCVVLRQSRWFQSAPFPPSSQPDFINGIISVSTTLNPPKLMEKLHRIETDFGRVRSVRNAARVLDLDLITFGNHVSSEHEWPVLPHPRMTERAFVLYPLRDIACTWQHPVRGVGLDELISALPPGQVCIPI